MGWGGAGCVCVGELSPLLRCLRQQNSRTCGSTEVETVVKSVIDDRRGIERCYSKMKGSEWCLGRWVYEVLYEMEGIWISLNFVSCASADRVATDDFLMDRYKTVNNTPVWHYIRDHIRGRRRKICRNMYRTKKKFGSIWWL